MDNDDFQSIAQTTLAADTFKSALREYRISLTEGRVGDAQPVFPFNNFNTPPNNRPAGIFQRVIELIDRIRATRVHR